MLGGNSLLLRGAQSLFGAAGGCRATGMNGSFEVAGGTTVSARWKFKKGSSKCKQGGNTPGKRLGLKKLNFTFVKTGQSIFLQRGTRMLPGIGTGVARDSRIYALQPGKVQYTKIREGRKAGRTQISVLNVPEDNYDLMQFRKHESLIALKRAARAQQRSEKQARREIVSEANKQMALTLHKGVHLRFRETVEKEGEVVWFP